MPTPNILLVVLDSVRARNTSLHGYSRETTPFLESFAQRSTIYEQARAPGVGSPQSHTSMFTGLDVEEHQLTDSSRKLRPGHTIYEALAERGYDTGVFSRNTYLTADTIGLSDTFQEVVSAHPTRFPSALAPHDIDFGRGSKMAQYLRVVLSDDEPFKSLYNGIEQKLEGSILEGALKRLTDVPEGQFYTDQFFKWRDSCDGPWAACINYMDAHWPFLPCLEYDNWEGVDRQTIRDIRDPTWQYYGGSRPLSERQAMVGNYDGCIRQTDAELERLIKGLRQRGELSDTLVVITADHGEGFGEKSPLRDSPSIGHGATGGLEEWILHVPLLLKLPGQTRGHRVSNPATLREFRDVVLDSLNGSVATDAFVPEGQVRASTLGQNPKTRQKAQRYVTDLPRYMPSGRVVYQPSPNGVRKSAVVEDQTGVFDCSRNSETAVENADATADISEAFNTLSRADVIKEMTDGVSEDVERRLKELGYR